MYNGHKRYAMFIGRWQPFHNRHKYLIDQVVAQGQDVCEELDNRGYKAIHLDGDDVRDKLNAFSLQDRRENLRRVAHVARLFNENGYIVIASFISPSNEFRRMVKNIIGNFKLVYAKCSLKTCEERDVTGMYKKARQGEIQQFTGVSAPFEEPTEVDVVVDTENTPVEYCVKEVLEAIGI